LYTGGAGDKDICFSVEVDSNNNLFVLYGKYYYSTITNILFTFVNCETNQIRTNYINNGCELYMWDKPLNKSVNNHLFVVGRRTNSTSGNKDVYYYGIPPFSPYTITGTGVDTNAIKWQWNDSLTERGYKIAGVNFDQTNTTSEDITNYTTTGLGSPNTVYTCVIIATNQYGWWESEPAWAYTLARPAFSFHSTYTTVSKIGLDWTGTGGTTYLIQHAYGNTSGPTEAFITVVSNYPNETYTNTGLQAGSTNWYRIRSYNGDGVVNPRWITNGPIVTKAGGLDVSEGPDNPSGTNITAGESGVVMLQFKLTAGINEGIVITNLVLQASGSGDDSTEIDKVYIYVDGNRNGIKDGPDIELFNSGGFSSDNGTYSIDLSANNIISAGTNELWLVVYDFKTEVEAGHSFQVSLISIGCKGSNSGTPYTPAGLPVNGNTNTIVAAAGANEPVVVYIKVTNTSGLSYYRGDITIKAKVNDEDGDTINFNFEYKSDSLGITWRTATIKENTSSLAQGVEHTFTWDSAKDMAGKSANDVLLRLIPNDGSLTGVPKEIEEPISVNNVELTDKDDVRIINTFQSMNEANQTEIMIKAEKSDEVTITVYDLIGRKIREIKQKVEPGFNTIPWDFKDDEGRQVGSDVYIIHIKGAGIDKYVKIAVWR
ncbi:MAG: hypothetical protein DRP08_07710, partial [Candidatus Aenigmatarchaeota archaeon]